jgi:KaiC/GvpD/RAD55 family RecA-like ATPase
MERKFIKSGIPGLDPVLGGGFLDGTITTVSGPTGSGKSTFAAQFIHNGAVEYNEPGLYLAIEESRRDFLFHMSGYEWDFGALERERKFVFLDYPIHEVDQIVSQSSAIHEIINTTGTKRVVIDSIMPIALYFKGDEERKKGFLKFIENLRKWNVTALIVSEDTKIAHAGARPGSEFGIESFTDGWINIFYKYDERSMERKRYIEVIKMKGVSHSYRGYPALLNSRGFSIMHELPPAQAAKPPKEPEKKLPEEENVEALVEKAFLPRAVERPPSKPPAATPPKPPPSAPKAPPPHPPSGARPSPPHRITLPPIPPKATAAPKAGPSKKLIREEEMEELRKLLGEEQKAEKKAEKPGKPAPKAGKKAPAKMSPSIAAKIAEAKKKLMKKG